MDVNRLSSISKADTLEKIGEFWDNHDFTDFDTDAPDVEFEIVCDEPKKATPLAAGQALESSFFL